MLLCITLSRSARLPDLNGLNAALAICMQGGCRATRNRLQLLMEAVASMSLQGVAIKATVAIINAEALSGVAPGEPQVPFGHILKGSGLKPRNVPACMS